MSFSQALAKIKENEEVRAKSTPIAMVAPELKQNTEDTEITKTCAVLGCEESKNLNSDSFFRFPEDPNFRQIWTDLTGRNNWTPTDYSYICVQHFSVDCFECDANDSVVLNSKAVPSLKLPKHVLEVEYIDEETLDNEYEDDYDDDDEEQDYDMDNLGDNTEYEEHLNEELLEEDHLDEEFHNSSYQHQQQQQFHQKQILQKHQSNQVQYQQQSQLQHQKIQQKQKQYQSTFNNVQQDTTNIKILTNGASNNHSTEKPSTSHTIVKKDEKSIKQKEQENLELLKMFTEIQMMQRQATNLKEKLRTSVRVHKRQKRCIARLKEEIDIKKKILLQRRKKKSRILLSLQDKIREDTNGLVLAMPTRHTDDLKNFALSIYKYSPQAYIYIRNTLRTLLPSTDVLDSWVLSGYEPTNILTNTNIIRVVSELTDSELSCKVSLR